MSITPPTLSTGKALARRAGVHRSVVQRLIAGKSIAPDAYLEIGVAGAVAPLFLPDRAIEVLRQAQAPRRPLAPKIA
jgi:hypothetical protein